MKQLRKEWTEELLNQAQALTKIGQVLYLLDMSVGEEIEKLGYKMCFDVSNTEIIITRRCIGEGNTLKEFTEVVQLVSEAIHFSPWQVKSAQTDGDIFGVYAQWHDPVKIDVSDYSQGALNDCPVEYITETKEVKRMITNCPELDALNKEQL